MLRRLHPSHRTTIALLEEALHAEKAALLIKARRLVKVTDTAAPPSYLQSRVTQGQPLPHVAQTPVGGGTNIRKKNELKIRTMLAFVCGVGSGPQGEGMPRKGFLVVLDFLMPTWDPVREANNAGGRSSRVRNLDVTRGGRGRESRKEGNEKGKERHGQDTRE